jgi:hypothetical protein
VTFFSPVKLSDLIQSVFTGFKSKFDLKELLFY